MRIAICCDSQDEYAALKRTVNEYAQEKNCFMIPQWFSTLEEFRRVNAVRRFSIVILAREDIDNQELAVSVRDQSASSQILWIGEDKRFGLSSYRVGAADFLLKPASREAIWKSLDRCVGNLSQSSGEWEPQLAGPHPSAK